MRVRSRKSRSRRGNSMSMTAFSGSRISILRLWPSGLTKAWTVTSLGMSCAAAGSAMRSNATSTISPEMLRAIKLSLPPPGGVGGREVKGPVDLSPPGTEKCNAFFGWGDGPAITPTHENTLGIRNIVLPSRRPHDALAHRRHRRHAFIVEALDAFSFIGFCRVQIASGVDSDAVHTIELTRLPSAVAE